MPNTCGVYVIDNQRNNKAYVGSTHAFYLRFDKHMKRAFEGYPKQLYEDMRSQNYEDFIVYFNECSEDLLLETEKKTIIDFEAYESGYNDTPDGTGCNFLNEETRIKADQHLRELKNNSFYNEDLRVKAANKGRESQKEIIQECFTVVAKKSQKFVRRIIEIELLRFSIQWKTKGGRS